MHLSGCEDTADSRDGENVRCAGGGKDGGWDLPFWVYEGGEEASCGHGLIAIRAGWMRVLRALLARVVERCWWRNAGGPHGDRHAW